MTDMHHIRRGSGKPLLLIHGLGGNTHSFDTILDALAMQREVIAVDLPGFGQTPPLEGEVSIQAPLVIGWGRQDRVCLPSQAELANLLFPDARLHWFEHCGHFPHWDSPEETVRLILATAADASAAVSSTVDGARADR